jgi:hypothetical protein
MDKLIAAFNIRLEEKQSRKRTLESDISSFESRYKEVQEECEHLKMLWQQAMVCDGGPIADAAEYQARQSYEEAAFNLKKAEDKKKTAEERLRIIEDSLSSQKEEYNTLSKELDNLLNLPDEKKAEAYYNCLLEDMQAAKSAKDYAALTKKFSDVSEYRDCAVLADKCMELNYCKLVESMNVIVAELNEDDFYIDDFYEWGVQMCVDEFYAIREYKDCAVLADKCIALVDKCMELRYRELVEEMQVAVSNENGAYLCKAAKGFHSMGEYKDCAKRGNLCCSICREAEAKARAKAQAAQGMTVKFEKLKSTFRWSKLILGLLTVVLTAFAMYKAHFPFAAGLLVWLVFAIVKGFVKNNPQFKEISTNDSITVRYNDLRSGITVLQGAIKKFYLWFAPLFAVSALLLWILL